MDIFDIILIYRDGWIRGLKGTLFLCSIIWISGLFLGTLLGIMASHWPNFIGIPSRVIAFLFSGIPIIVFLFWIHYPLQTFFQVSINPFYTAGFSLSAINIILVSEIVFNKLSDFPSQYIVAAKVCGMSSWEIFRFIQFPIILRQVLPSLLSLQVNMLQMSLFASLIGANEIFRVAQQINASIYKPVEIYTALAFFFLLICLPLNGLSLWLRKRYTKNISDR